MILAKKCFMLQVARKHLLSQIAKLKVGYNLEIRLNFLAFISKNQHRTSSSEFAHNNSSRIELPTLIAATLIHDYEQIRFLASDYG